MAAAGSTAGACRDSEVATGAAFDLGWVDELHGAGGTEFDACATSEDNTTNDATTCPMTTGLALPEHQSGGNTVPSFTAVKASSTTKRSHPSSDTASDKDSGRHKRRRNSKTSSQASTASPEVVDPVVKRQRNTEAARRYRQRKQDRVTELEEALAEMTKDRDELKLKLARSETEVRVLRGMVSGGKD